MKKIILLFIFTLGINLSADNEFGIICKNFSGSSLDFEGGKPNISKDGYSGTTIKFSAGSSGGLVEYSGNVNRKDAVKVLAGSEDGFYSFYQNFSDVHKIYTVYLSDPIVLSITELQTQLYNGNPQVRTFMGSCN
jgi:hypothetical protein